MSPPDVDGNTIAVVVTATRPTATTLAFLGLFLGGIRDDQAGGGGLLGLNLTDDDAVLEGLDGDDIVAPFFLSRRCSSFPAVAGVR